MTRVSFEIPGRPIPWKRMGRNGKSSFPQAGQTEAKKAVGNLCKDAMRDAGVCMADKDVPVSVNILAVYSLPMTIPKGDCRRMGSAHTMTPDADNIAKLIKDGLSGIAYKDDCQVYELVVRKVWSDHDRTCVTIEHMEGRK